MGYKTLDCRVAAVIIGNKRNILYLYFLNFKAYTGNGMMGILKLKQGVQIHGSKSSPSQTNVCII